MLTCRQVVERSSDWVDRDLGWRDRLGMQMHVLFCRHCRNFLHAVAGLGRQLSRLEEKEAVSDAFVSRVLDRVDTDAVGAEESKQGRVFSDATVSRLHPVESVSTQKGQGESHES